VKLNADEERVRWQLDALHSFTVNVLANELQPSRLKLGDVLGVDFVAVTVTLLDDGLAAVQMLCKKEERKKKRKNQQ
jgi:hypothetical protein